MRPKAASRAAPAETPAVALGELAARVGGAVVGDPETAIRGANGIREAGPGEITFLANPRYARFAATTRARP